MPEWTLTYDAPGGGDAVTKKLREWKIVRCSKESAQQEVDVVTLETALEDATGADVFVHGSIIEIHWGERRWFRGAIVDPESSVSAAAEGKVYQAQGLWRSLTRTPFLQNWYDQVNAVVLPIAAGYLFRDPRLIDGDEVEPDPLDTAAQVEAALEHAIDEGRDLEIGTIDGGIKIPFQEFDQASVAEVIRTVLRWTPDAVCWVDYEATTPTVHCRRRANLTAINFAVTDGAVTVAPTHDLATPGVRVVYREKIRPDAEDDPRKVVNLKFTVDKWPTDLDGTEEGRIEFVFDKEEFGDEGIPTGDNALAKTFYLSANAHAWRGTLTHEAEELIWATDVASAPLLGRVVNITGATNADWATMAAVIQRVTEDIFTGTTTAEFGPPERLGMEDLRDLALLNRRRKKVKTSDLDAQTFGFAPDEENEEETRLTMVVTKLKDDDTLEARKIQISGVDQGLYSDP